jgi:superfamily II DNA or RNA helicase
MRNIDPISIETARELIDFSGGSLSPSLAKDQLEGAVAIHNILAKEGFAYLADEVGMGKTYVALGVMGLIRFFNPGIRVLYIAPRENIQTKWIKELRNFTRNNWLNVDQLVKSVQGIPCVDIAKCENLADWALQAVRNPNRDFFLRLTSFSLPLSSDSQKWRSKRDELEKLAPMVDSSLLDLRNKERFKETYAQILNTLLPHYDLVVIDEAHNLKQGMKSLAARNRLLSLLLGRAAGSELAGWPNYGRRFDRVLLLSATPLETDYAEIWHQLDLFGLGENIKRLQDAEVDDAEKRSIVARFLIRRLTGLVMGGKTHTKNMYRREWRRGGCVIHDEPLEIPDQRQRLIVALVQKKVAEALNNSRFNASFQIGMLASFESFLETAKVKSADDEEAVFDQSEQAEDQLEKEGIDTPAVNRLAESYRREFGQPLPHPKMDAIVQTLKETFDTGAKSLVFVRRVKSVTELREKLCREYDAWLKKQLLAKLPEGLHREIDGIWNQYEEERREVKRVKESGFWSAEDYEPMDGDGLLVDQEELPDGDEGGIDTFFAWFFRGEGPPRLLSGAAFRKNRLQGMGSAYSTFFEDNYTAALIGLTEGAFDGLADELEWSREELKFRLREIAYSIYRNITRQKTKFPRLIVFHSYQVAALDLLARSASALARDAKVILRERYPGYTHQAMLQPPDGFPEPEEFINTETFFTELRLRPSLRDDLWPKPTGASLLECFANQERRRELLAAVARLGHAFIDLWALFAARVGSIKMGAQERSGERAEALIQDYLDLLEKQKGERGLNAYQELAEVGHNYDLIFSVNFPESVGRPLAELSRLFGRALSRQSPVGGMYGGVNTTLVKQFRMPGYPLALITTDVLQEGEDLHTFCSRIVHYGISWTPSAMEQRTGRVDRIGSLTHRRLDNREMRAHPDELLQVYYPYLADTVEVLQVERVFERMNRFINLIHTFGKEETDSRLNTLVEFVRSRRNIDQITEKLESAFTVQQSQLKGLRKTTGGPCRQIEDALNYLRLIAGWIEKEIRIEWEEFNDRATLYGTVFTDSGRLLYAGDLREVGTGYVRRQPFALILRSSGMGGPLLLHGVSPVGNVSTEGMQAVEIVMMSAEIGAAKLCEVPGPEFETYTLTVEGDIIFDPKLTQAEEAIDLLSRITIAADWTERSLLEGLDQPFAAFRKDLHREAHRATD